MEIGRSCALNIELHSVFFFFLVMLSVEHWTSSSMLLFIDWAFRTNVRMVCIPMIWSTYTKLVAIVNVCWHSLSGEMKKCPWNGTNGRFDDEQNTEHWTHCVSVQVFYRKQTIYYCSISTIRTTQSELNTLLCLWIFHKSPITLLNTWHFNERKKKK